LLQHPLNKDRRHQHLDAFWGLKWIAEEVEEMEGENLADFDLAPNPSLLIDMELPTGAHA
jgi:hypothetical protein